jgi:hypothetical protein
LGFFGLIFSGSLSGFSSGLPEAGRQIPKKLHFVPVFAVFSPFQGIAVLPKSAFSKN